MYDDLQRFWKEAVLDISSYCPRIFLEGVRKSIKYLRILS
jgi:hypothetical protein